jgi:hypothetical protein
MSSKIIIFKNDATGDFIHSLYAINNIIINNKDKNIIIYLSERSKNFSKSTKSTYKNYFLLNFNMSYPFCFF